MTPSAESVISCADDQVVQPWQAEPYKLWSLLDMLIFSANAFFWCGRALRSVKGDCVTGAVVCVEGQPGFALFKDLDDRASQKALSALTEVETHSRSIGMAITADMTKDLIGELNSGSRHSFDWLATQIDTIERLADKELKGKLFFYVPTEQAKFWPTTKEPNMFGDDVAQIFPDAVADIGAANRCLALNEWNASVFHAMRVLEHGLQPIAVRFNVPFAVDSWHKVIKGIEDGLTDLRNKKGLSDQDRKEITYYSDAASQFRHFKDAWRNHVSHGRKFYDGRDAEKVLTSVRELMQHLATPV